jgi:hypothetical protein
MKNNKKPGGTTISCGFCFAWLFKMDRKPGNKGIILIIA